LFQCGGHDHREKRRMMARRSLRLRENSTFSSQRKQLTKMHLTAFPTSVRTDTAAWLPVKRGTMAAISLRCFPFHHPHCYSARNGGNCLNIGISKSPICPPYQGDVHPIE